MGYPGRQNIYEATIRRLVNQALEAQELQFRREHERDTDGALLEYLRTWAGENGHTPWPGELVGGVYLSERFGSWERAAALAGLPPPKPPNRPQAFRRIIEETERQREFYRQRKAEKKQLARKRVAEQNARKRSREKQ